MSLTTFSFSKAEKVVLPEFQEEFKSNFPENPLTQGKVTRPSLVWIPSSHKINTHKEKKEKRRTKSCALFGSQTSFSARWTIRSAQAKAGVSTGSGPDRISPKLRPHMALAVESPALSCKATSQLKCRGVFLGLTWTSELLALLSDSFSGYSPCPTSGWNNIYSCYHSAPVLFILLSK